MTTSAPVVREAQPGDLERVADIFLACWRGTYAGFLPDRAIAIFDDRGARDLWRPTLTGLPDDGVVLVAERPGEPVLGVVRLGTDPDEHTAGHIFSLYAHPDAQGLGVGRLLLTAAEARFGRLGIDVATLWVFAANDQARRFYQRMGWRPDGATRVEARYGEPEIRLRRTMGLLTGNGDE